MKKGKGGERKENKVGKEKQKLGGPWGFVFPQKEKEKGRIK